MVVSQHGTMTVIQLNNINKMEDYKKEFIDFVIESGVLRFGSFTLKSGRKSPYFFNSGLFNTGKQLSELGKFYAKALVESKIKYDGIFGPAYKGIPLVSALSIALSNEYNINIPYSFNRKEIKQHAEGGLLVGASLKGNIVIVDDVISAGTSVRESCEIIKNEAANPCTVLIALDRQERGKGDKTTIDEITKDLELQVISIISLTDIIEYLSNSDKTEILENITEYQKIYG